MTVPALLDDRYPQEDRRAASPTAYGHLKELLEEKIRTLGARLDATKAEMDRALALALAVADSGVKVARSEAEKKADDIDKHLVASDARIVALEKIVDNVMGRFWALGAALGVFSLLLHFWGPK